MIGIYGGTFDPIHFGHLRTALDLRQRLQLHAVRMIPAHVPPHRPPPVASAEARWAMLELALAGQAELVADDRELRRPGPSYMVDTLSSLRAELGDQPMGLILGMDAFLGLEGWHRWERLLELAHLVVLHRAHIWGEELKQRVPEELRLRMIEVEPFARVPDPASQTVYLINHEPFPISGTSIRARQSRGLPIRELVPHEIYSYIQKYGLYRREGEDLV